MKFEIQHKPSYALAIVHLDAGETVVAEGGALVSRDQHITMETRAGAEKGGGMMKGLMSGLKRMVAGESFFQNRFTASQPGHVTFAPTHVGDIEVYELAAADDLFLQSTAFLCSADGIKVDTKWGGAKTFFGGEGLVMLRCHGQGDLWVSSYGAIHAVQVDGSYTVDTGHIVAFEEGLQFSVRKEGSMKSLFFGGEGLVCEFTGKGTLWFQTRNAAALASFLHPFRRVKPKNNN